MESIKLSSLVESKQNPRKHWDVTQLDELARSIEKKGIIEPIIIRKLPVRKGGPRGGKAPRYEIIAGARRYRAAKSLGLTTVPVRVHESTTIEALEISIIENLQRADIHPLEEGDGYLALIKADKTKTPEAIAAEVGKSISYVYQRLKLTNLQPRPRKAFMGNEITAAHAVKLARLDAPTQARALDHCWYPLLMSNGGRSSLHEPAPISRLDGWLRDHVKVDPVAEDTPHYFPELAADFAAAVADEEVEASTIVQLSDSGMPGAQLGDKKHGLVGRLSWTEVKTAKQKCPDTRQGVIVHGGPLRVLDVCVKRGCPKHRPPKKKTAGASKTTGATLATTRQADEARWKKQEDERKAWDKVRPAARAAFVKHVRGLKVTPDLVRRTLRHERGEVVKAIGNVTVKNMGQALAVSIVWSETWSQAQFARSTKGFGFNLAAVLQQQAAGPTKKTAGTKPYRGKTKSAKKRIRR